jgi:pimeloyl-ACP methyl ester carboxylesterase
MIHTEMERADIEGMVLEYEVAGEGEPVICIHGALIADTFRPLLAEPGLSERYRLISYHRRGHAGSSRAPDPVTFAQQAADCRALLTHLGVERAHVVGHSSGGSIALQLALDVPEVVHSLVLLEPALAVGASAEVYRAALAQGSERYREVGAAVVVDEFLEARWPGYRATLDEVLPGAFAQAVDDAGTGFEQETPALLDWRFAKVEARQIRQPVLAVLGGESEALWPRFGVTFRWLLSSFPHVEGFVLPGTTHLMQVEKPREMAEGLAEFWERHPLPMRNR